MTYTLQHSGVLGMHWGRRKGESTSTGPPSADHATVSAIKRKHLSEMSNDDIAKLVARTTLENQYKTIKSSKVAVGKKLATDMFGTPVKVAIAGAVGMGAAMVAKSIVKQMIEKAAWSTGKKVAQGFVEGKFK